MIETLILDEAVDYTGEQLRSHFVLDRTGIRSDGVVAFRGACAVTGPRLVDLEDARQHSSIIAEEMIHFIGEHFEIPLREANCRLRIFVGIIADMIRELAPGAAIVREGDDLFSAGRKLTVAIATVTPVSAVFHCGVNIDPRGAPVPAVGLSELGVEPRALADGVLERYSGECLSIDLAVRKVRGVP